MGDGVAGRGKVALQVDPGDRIPLLLAHVGQHPVPKKAGVAHQGVQTAKRRDGLSHHLGGLVPVGHIGTVGHRLTPVGLDLGNYVVGRPTGRILTVSRHA